MNFLNRCVFQSGSNGTADFTIANAVDGFYIPSQCQPPAVAGKTYHYFAESQNKEQHEEGDCVIVDGVVQRVTVRNSSNGGAKVPFTAAPVVTVGGPVAEDMNTLDIIEDAATQRFGFGVDSVDDLASSRVTIAPTLGGFGDDLATNGSFAGNADGWTLGSGWAYDTNKVKFTPYGGFGEVVQDISGLKVGSTYQVTVTVSNYVAGNLYGGTTDGTQDFGVSGDGTYSIEVVCETSVGAQVMVGANTPDFEGSVTNIELREKLSIVTDAHLHEDKTPALIIETSSTGAGEPARIKVDTANQVEVTSTTFSQKQSEGGKFKVSMTAQQLTADRALWWPDAPGVIQVTPLGGVLVSELAVDPSETLAFSSFVYDSTVGLAAGLGTAVVGGGTDYVPVYWDANAQVWKIG